MARSAAPRLGDTTSPQDAGLPFRLRGAEQRRGGGSGASVLSQGTVPVGRPAAPRPTYVRPSHGGPRLHGNEGASPGMPAPGLCPDRPRETTFPDAGRAPGSNGPTCSRPRTVSVFLSIFLLHTHTHTQRSFAVISDYKDNHDWGGQGSRREETPPGLPPALTNETSCSRARAAVILQGRGPEPHAGLQPVRTLSGSALRGGHALQEPFFESLTLKLHPEGIAQVPNSLLNINRSQETNWGEAGGFYLRKG